MGRVFTHLSNSGVGPAQLAEQLRKAPLTPGAVLY